MGASLWVLFWCACGFLATFLIPQFDAAVIVLDAESGDPVFFNSKLLATSNQLFEVFLPQKLSDLNIVLNLPPLPTNTFGQLKASFCLSKSEADDDYKVIAGDIKGPISQLLTHEEMLGLLFWTSCHQKIGKNPDNGRPRHIFPINLIAKQSALFRKLFLQLLFTEFPINGSVKQEEENELEMSISAKSLESFSSYPINSPRARKKRPGYQRIRDFTLNQLNQTKTFVFQLTNFQSAMNVSMTTDSNLKAGNIVEVYASVCEDRMGTSSVLSMSDSSQYHSAVLNANNLIPADLNCLFDLANPMVFLTLKMAVANSTGLKTLQSGTIALWQAEDSPMEHGHGWSREEHLLKDQRSDQHQLHSQPIELDVNVRLGSVEVLLTCQDQTSSNGMALGNFSRGEHIIAINWTTLEHLNGMMSCDGDQESAISNHTNLSTNATKSPFIWITGLEEENIVWLDVHNDEDLWVPEPELTTPSSGLSWPFVVLLVLLAMTLASGIGWSGYYFWQRRRSHRYYIQRRVVLQRESSTRPNCQSVAVPAINTAVAQRNINSFELNNGGWNQ